VRMKLKTHLVSPLQRQVGGGGRPGNVIAPNMLTILKTLNFIR
jgi:hypothetical protein